jgi:trans-aconitate methyltransferase
MVLDLGCGPGHTLAALQRRWPETTLAGLDLQPAGARQAGLDSGVLLG